MKTNKKIILTSCALALCASLSAQTEKTPAFPGAEGFGRYTTGGRGGAVYHVTSLADDGSEGTLRWACNKSGTRTIVFDVSGTIYLTSALKLNKGDVTIAGQTAPGDGICIADYPFQLSANNIILRYLRFRLGNQQVAHHEGDGLGGMDKKDWMVDHCSVSWSIDECLSVYGSKNTTVQWCIASQSLKNAGHSKGSHGYGGNWGGSGASYHHNLIAHNESRTPRLGPRPGTQTDERMDMRNNVIYNWAGNGCYGGEGMNVNIVNNYYKPGPATKTVNTTKQMRIAAPGIRTVDYCLDKDKTVKNFNKATGKSYVKSQVSGSAKDGVNYVTIGGKKFAIDMDTNTINVGDTATVTVGWNDWKKMLHVWCQLYVEGNYNPDYDELNSDNFLYGISKQIDKTGNDGTYPGDDAIKLSAPIDFVATTTHSAADAFERVLSYVGASLHRDALDATMISDTRDGVATYTGSGNASGIINTQDDCGGWPELTSTAAPTDTDGDGMPDEWETANGLNPNDASDRNTVNAEGYTNLELYLNSLVADITAAQNAGGTVEGYVAYTDGSTSGISSVTAPIRTADNHCYNLAGQRVDDSYKGIVIRNGRKFIQK